MPREVTINWGGTKISRTVYDPVVVDPNQGIFDPDTKSEAELLPQVADLGKAGLVMFLIGIETQVEMSGLPNLDSTTGDFYGVLREVVPAPIQYGRILYGGNEDWFDGQYKFIWSIKDDRFLQLQRITGAHPLKGQSKPVHRNQVLDAFHLWCAEHNAADFFLSLDFKLARVIEKSKIKPMVRVVRPSELLKAVR